MGEFDTAYDMTIQEILGLYITISIVGRHGTQDVSI